jgi:preprotein translocase subunit YajC
MNSEDSNDDSERSRLSQQAITDCFQALEEGDKLVINGRETVFEVVETERYSVIAVDSKGNEYTLSQNLQTGGWSVHEDVWWITSVDPTDSDGG